MNDVIEKMPDHDPRALRGFAMIAERIRGDKDTARVLRAAAERIDALEVCHRINVDITRELSEHRRVVDKIWAAGFHTYAAQEIKDGGFRAELTRGWTLIEGAGPTIAAALEDALAKALAE